MKKLLVLGVLGLALAVPVSARLGDPDPQTEWLEQRQELRVETKQAVKNAVEEVKQVRERLRETLQTKLQLIKNQKKKTITERMNNRLCEVNQTRVAVMNKHLDKMLEVLARVESKSSETSVVTAVATARTAVASAKTAVEAQGKIACELVISGDETKLGAEVSAAINKLHTQLQTVFEKVVGARTASRNAVTELAKVLGEKAGGESE